MPQAPNPQESLQKLTETGNCALKVCGTQGRLVFARTKLLLLLVYSGCQYAQDIGHEVGIVIAS